MSCESVVFGVFNLIIRVLKFRFRISLDWAVVEALIIVKAALFRESLSIYIALISQLFFHGFCWRPWALIWPFCFRKSIKMVVKSGSLSFRLLELIFLCQFGSLFLLLFAHALGLSELLLLYFSSFFCFFSILSRTGFL